MLLRVADSPSISVDFSAVTTGRPCGLKRRWCSHARPHLAPTRAIRWSRPGARCRHCCWSVSPGRSPNPACGSHRTGLSMVSAVAWGHATVKGGLHPRYPPPRTHPNVPGQVVAGRCVTIRWRVFRHYSLHSLLVTTAALRHVTGSPGLGLLRRLRPTPDRSADGVLSLRHVAGRDDPGRPGVVPVFTCRSLDGGGTRLGPCDIAVATPQHVTTASPPSRRHVGEFPASVMRETGARRFRPRSARFEPVRL
jgi:hypothetical protein